VVLGLEASLAGGGVFTLPSLTAFESGSQPPLAFAIADPAQRLTTVRAAETGPMAMRVGDRFEASRPVAQKIGKKFLLRDHAPAQLEVVLVVGAKRRRAGGADVGPRRARL
jgi:hypothetical protein